ncbi:MAG: hypothetical protein ACE5IR_23110 [bacterium]
MTTGDTDDRGRGRSTRCQADGPVLANIYLHYVIDLWFENVVEKQMAGKRTAFAMRTISYSASSIAKTSNLSFDTTVGFGLNDESPDYIINMGVVYGFE